MGWPFMAYFYSLALQIGHYASCCKGGKNLKFGTQGTTQQQGGRQQRHGKGRQANQVEDHCNESDEDDTFAILY